jgi:hypothetical protein
VFGAKIPEWSLPVSKEITAAPVLRSKSVYFVAGNVIYRVNASDGAICWKQTLALNAGETLTELTFVGDELHASGGGVLVRIADRGEPKPLFQFAPKLFGAK